MERRVIDLIQILFKELYELMIGTTRKGKQQELSQMNVAQLISDKIWDTIRISMKGFEGMKDVGFKE